MGTEDLLIGRLIATKFAIESVIGSGAMGVVYRARHVALDKPVAVKVLHQELAKDETFGARLRREAKAASRLDHPNSVRVIDFGEEPDGLLYIAMELLDGLDLFQTLERQWPISDIRTIDLVCQTLSALAVAHDMGIVHRDLKPENIMLIARVDDDGGPRDIVKVCDFGIAKTADASDDPKQPGKRALTTQGILIGTPEYMSPEQCRGQPLDARSDLYSVGVILYQILTGRLPFQAASAIDVVLKHVSEEPEPPSAIRPGLSPKLEEVCLRALRKRPDDRYANAREMRAELRAIVDVATSDASPLSPELRLIARNAETLLSAVTAPVVETAAPIDAGTPPPSATHDESRQARSRGRLRYAAMIAVPAVVVAAVAIGSQRSSSLQTLPSLPVTSAPAETAKVQPEMSPLLEMVHADAPAPPPVAARPSKSSVIARPRAVVRTTSMAPVQPPLMADSEPEPRITSPPPAIVPPIPSPLPEMKAILPAPPEPPAPSPAPPSIHFDPSRGRVAWNVSTASGGATVGNVARALARASGPWQRCYQTALESRGASVEGAATLRLTCDQQGRVVDVTFSGFDVADMSSCIRAASKGLTIPNADTGEAWASVALAFKVVE